MLDDLGVRVERVASKVIRHGDPAVENNLVGFAAKSEPLGRYDDPSLAAAKEIAENEPYVLFIGGVHELDISAAGPGPEAAAVEDLLFIDPTDNSVVTQAEAEAPEADAHPLGVVQEVDEGREVALVNTHALHVFWRVI